GSRTSSPTSHSGQPAPKPTQHHQPHPDRITDYENLVRAVSWTDPLRVLHPGGAETLPESRPCRGSNVEVLARRSNNSRPSAVSRCGTMTFTSLLTSPARACGFPANRPSPVSRSPP